MLALGNYTRKDSFLGLGAVYDAPDWPAALECPRGTEPSLAFGAPRCIDVQGNETNPVRRSAPVMAAVTVAPAGEEGWVFPPLVIERAGSPTIRSGPGISSPVLIAAVVGVGLLGLAAVFMK